MRITKVEAIPIASGATFDSSAAIVAGMML